MKVLIACEFSGRVRSEFERLGHDAWSCDFEPCEIGGKHIIANVSAILDDGWDLMIAHPPCTRLCNSGVRWLYERHLWNELAQVCDFFNSLLNAPIPRIAVENPTMHKYARMKIRRPDFCIHPWNFGDNESKRTCFWLKGLEPLTPDITEPPIFVDNTLHRNHTELQLRPGEPRWQTRSRTFLGIAKAIAKQWGGIAG